MDEEMKNQTNLSETPEERENYLISLAMDLAEQKLKDGTASSQLISHFLKIGCLKEQNEILKTEKEIELLEAKTSSLKSATHSEQLISEALAAMKKYSYNGIDVCD